MKKSVRNKWRAKIKAEKLRKKREDRTFLKISAPVSDGGEPSRNGFRAPRKIYTERDLSVRSYRVENGIYRA